MDTNLYTTQLQPDSWRRYERIVCIAEPLSFVDQQEEEFHSLKVCLGMR